MGGSAPGEPLQLDSHPSSSLVALSLLNNASYSAQLYSPVSRWHALYTWTTPRHFNTHTHLFICPSLLHSQTLIVLGGTDHRPFATGTQPHLSRERSMSRACGLSLEPVPLGSFSPPLLCFSISRSRRRYKREPSLTAVVCLDSSAT